MNARSIVLLALLALSHARCDRPRESSSAARDAGSTTRAAPVDAGVPDDRVVVRKSFTYYHWTRTDPQQAGSDEPGTEHGRLDLTLLFEVHRNPRNEGWLTVGALGANVGVHENSRLVGDGLAAEWNIPRGGFLDLGKDIFGGELRSDEPVRAFLAAQPERTIEVTPGRTPAWVRLPAEGTLAATPRASEGRYEAVLVFVIPMRNRHGGRYLLQVFDLAARSGGFSQNGVMDHAPSVAEINRYIAWMRDPRGMNANRPPPVAAMPIDRT